MTPVDDAPKLLPGIGAGAWQRTYLIVMPVLGALLVLVIAKEVFNLGGPVLIWFLPALAGSIVALIAIAIGCRS